jgi:putative membrane protein
MVMITHVPGVVNTSVRIAWLHYLLHSLIVLAALIMWMPVCGPFRELRIGYGAQMIYLFLQSVVPTVPAGWLTFAEGVVYKHYDIPVRVWGLSATHDQQIAGVIMKIGGGFFLWTIVIVLFFRRFSFRFSQDNDATYRRSAADSELPDRRLSAPFAPPASGETPLTYEQVFRVFETVPPAPEP